MNMSVYAVETRKLIKHYNKGKVKAVNGLDLRIKKGEIYALIGANGSGKTTTIDMLSGVLMPTAGEIITFFGKLYSLSREEIENTGKMLLEILNLEEKKDVIAEQLSGGMKRRLSIACALIHQPPLLLFDEATVGVDPVLRVYFWNYFRKLRDSGKTILITSHVMDEAEKADRIGLMRAGVLIEEGTPSELKQKYSVDTIEEVFIHLSGDEVIDE